MTVNAPAPLRVKPAPGKGARYQWPDKRILPAEGANVPRSGYWWRRLVRGDVVICDPPEIEQAAPEAAPEKTPRRPHKGEHKEG